MMSNYKNYGVLYITFELKTQNIINYLNLDIVNVDKYTVIKSHLSTVFLNTNCSHLYASKITIG